MNVRGKCGWGGVPARNKRSSQSLNENTVNNGKGSAGNKSISKEGMVRKGTGTGYVERSR